MSSVKNCLGRLIRTCATPVPADALFWAGKCGRKLRRRMANRGRSSKLPRAMDFFCCSLPPKWILCSVPCDGGSCPMYLRVNDPYHYELASGTHEERVEEWLAENLERGGAFFDVGANIGYYTILGARRVGKAGVTVGIEADPKIAGMLERNVRANELQNVRVISGAVSNQKGVLRLGRGAASGWSGIYCEKPKSWIEVPALTIDGILADVHLRERHPVIIKLDVEGAEAEVLEGMHATLESLRPKLLIEIHRTRAGGEERVHEILRRNGYAVSVLDDGGATAHIVATPAAVAQAAG